MDNELGVWSEKHLGPSSNVDTNTGMCQVHPTDKSQVGLNIHLEFYY